MHIQCVPDPFPPPPQKGPAWGQGYSRVSTQLRSANMYVGIWNENALASDMKSSDCDTYILVWHIHVIESGSMVLMS